MKNIVYLAVTPDKYELPIAIFNNWKEACGFSGKSYDSLRSSIARQQVDRKNKCRYISVRLDKQISEE